MTDAQKEQLQQRIELIHANWPKNQDYMAPPSSGELATFDSALLVSPPPGMEIGYVRSLPAKVRFKDHFH